MEKQVIVIIRDKSQMGERAMFELEHIHNIPNIKLLTPVTTPQIFEDFKKQFNINVFPVVQIGENNKFISIHMDPNHEESIKGAGGRKINDFSFVKVNNVEELIAKAIEIYKS